MRIHLDENLSSEIARLLRARGVEAVSAHEARKRQLSDRAQLEFATTQDRVIVTAGGVVTLRRLPPAHGCSVSLRFRGDRAGVLIFTVRSTM